MTTVAGFQRALFLRHYSPATTRNIQAQSSRVSDKYNTKIQARRKIHVNKVSWLVWEAAHISGWYVKQMLAATRAICSPLPFDDITSQLFEFSFYLARSQSSSTLVQAPRKTYPGCLYAL